MVRAPLQVPCRKSARSCSKTNAPNRRRSMRSWPSRKPCLPSSATRTLGRRQEAHHDAAQELGDEIKVTTEAVKAAVEALQAAPRRRLRLPTRVRGKRKRRSVRKSNWIANSTCTQRFGTRFDDRRAQEEAGVSQSRSCLPWHRWCWWSCIWLQRTGERPRRLHSRVVVVGISRTLPAVERQAVRTDPSASTTVHASEDPGASSRC